MKYKKTALLMILAVGGASLVFMFGFNALSGETGEPPQTAITPSGPEQTMLEPEDTETVSDDHPAVGEPEQEPVPEPEGPEMAEFRCDCTGYCDGWPARMNPELLEKIEALRQHYGRPVIITSGVRCEERNAEVGGVAWSFHKRGDAADLYCPGVAVGDLAQTAKALGMNILPYYASGYVHVEV